MKRLQKKCFIVSAGTHLLLALILLVGPAFLSQKSKLEDIQPLNFIPENLVLGAVAGGGNPRAATRPPPPPAPISQVTPPQQRQREPDPPKTTEVKHKKADADSLEVAKEPKKPRLPDVNTKLVSRKSDSSKKQKQPPTADSRERERELADSRIRSEAFNRAARSLGNNAASATIVDQDFGPGGGGPTYASYASWVQTVYLGAWVPPDSTDSTAAIARASITIASDGSVVSYRLIGKSGDRDVDESIQRTLERVTSIGRPFPEGMKEKQRTYILRFDLKAKQGLA
jgi:outer membrane biosynthesis protein TonB